MDSDGSADDSESGSDGGPDDSESESSLSQEVKNFGQSNDDMDSSVESVVRKRRGRPLQYFANGATDQFAHAAETEFDAPEDEDSTTGSALTSSWTRPTARFDYHDPLLEQQSTARTIRFQRPDTPGGVRLADGIPVFAAAEPRAEADTNERAETYLLAALLQIVAAQKTKLEGSLPVVADRIWRAPSEAGEEQPASAPALCIVKTMSANVWNSGGDPGL
ncbi:hypothetical protein K466DRAFT_607839 [Polyporus arcularius HHB13444]|uniref:Uncharacterized protein n=1 Tax=Polyporus arcularius HHB13444 TaxID=1314778 RepID=A0A5C3NIW5_9APHY|nr:hypothetical protein K466DRAFT_607839 [Polyporus arcularius HHB13444]